MYEFTGKIRYSEIDSDGKLSLEALLNYFQDCSTFQSEDMGVGLEYLGKQELAWVVSSWQIVVERFPALCEPVTIGTMPYAFKGFLGSRNFYMKDEAGNYLAKANSLWAMVDTKTMKPAIPTEQILKAYPPEQKLEMDYAPRKILIPDSGDIQAGWEEEMVVRPYHLDTNHHMNNGQYIRMAMSYLPQGTRIRQMRAEYKKQALLGNVIRPYVATDHKQLYVVELCDEEGKPYANVEFLLQE